MGPERKGRSRLRGPEEKEVELSKAAAVAAEEGQVRWEARARASEVEGGVEALALRAAPEMERYTEESSGT